SRLDCGLDAQVSERLRVQHQLLPAMQLHGLSSIFSLGLQHSSPIIVQAAVVAPALIAVLTLRFRSVSVFSTSFFLLCSFMAFPPSSRWVFSTLLRSSCRLPL